MRDLTIVEKQWLFTKDDLHRTPSVLGGMLSEKELQKRKITINHIRGLGRGAGLYDPRDPNHKGARGVMTVASTLLHRFYMRRSFKDFSEELIAGTILFLASKIEEEPLKLRYICNSCLDRFNQTPGEGWHPGQQENPPPPSLAYQKWEKDILATEEIVLETLCFDMGIEQPWVVLQRSLRGLDDLPLNQAESSKQAEQRAQSIEKLSEAVVAELGWAILNEAYSSPLPILYPAPILAFSTLVLLIALLERIPLSRAAGVGSELAERFGLDIHFDEKEGAIGPDLVDVRLCLEHFLEYCKADLIDPALVSFVAAEPETPPTEPYVRRYQIDGPGSPARVDAMTHAAAAELGTVPVVGADSATSVKVTPMYVDSVTEAPPQEAIKSQENVNGTTQSTEDDLFGDSTTVEPASAMSPPRY